MNNLPITRNGYLYVYTSNESPVDVFFDNLQVIHTRGPLLEETHYYPFGLTMAGISSKAAGKLENRYKYNGIELDEDLGLNAYEAHFRTLDPAIGRWWQIDPKVEEAQESLSPYASMANDPILKSDPLGDIPDGGCCGLADVVVAIVKAVDNIKQNVEQNVKILKLNNEIETARTGESFLDRGLKSAFSFENLGGPVTGEFKLIRSAIKTEVAVEKEAIKEFTVGSYNDLKASAKGTGMEAHHVGQATAMEQVIPEYNRKTAPAILVKKEGHTVSGPNGIVKRSTSVTSPPTARGILARDIKELRRVYNAPNDKLQEVIKMNKEMYFDSFIKK